ncbi:hypothetical protein SLEP1_g8896 [Rubroshorea leprosula]|uniref:Uncharacterized protein n=1 Tax=Rubroshorea leprosula TaxID=152421 RepID=A0AAV5IBJ4_9ROSI|nr:hypothetical protein SLEP1_g8896 [Rubroshorea leprosula]
MVVRLGERNIVSQSLRLLKQVHHPLGITNWKAPVDHPSCFAE